MKTSALLLVLLAAAWTGSQGMSLRSSKPQCCSEKMLTRKKIPEFMIQGYRETNPSCSIKAFLVELPRGRSVYVDPKQEWFQKYLSKQEKKKQKQPNSTST